MLLLHALLTPVQINASTGHSITKITALVTVSFADLELLEDKGHACACSVFFSVMSSSVHVLVGREWEEEGKDVLHVESCPALLSSRSLFCIGHRDPICCLPTSRS